MHIMCIYIYVWILDDIRSDLEESGLIVSMCGGRWRFLPTSNNRVNKNSSVLGYPTIWGYVGDREIVMGILMIIDVQKCRVEPIINWLPLYNDWQSLLTLFCNWSKLYAMRWTVVRLGFCKGLRVPSPVCTVEMEGKKCLILPCAFCTIGGWFRIDITLRCMIHVPFRTAGDVNWDHPRYGFVYRQCMGKLIWKHPETTNQRISFTAFRPTGEALGSRTLQESQQHPARPRTGEPLLLEKSGVAQDSWLVFWPTCNRYIRYS